ncbi:conserved hypothetical protein [Histoplasma capsulatum H143]|uniref:Cyclin-like domain-containing protein n=1 Tax=Ajellomyces capsulatus (strain H143) TaxID=544712 RepID=C6HLN7_AJECH|nr:conserved hypothetical protein [Histoplasma capsulatum H143]
MLEDEIYRTSSQYRLWSFTEESLRLIRANSNTVASERVKDAIRRAKNDARSQQPATTGARSSSGTPNTTGDADDGKTAEPTIGNGEQTTEKEKDKEIECLTMEEELELVRYYCEKTMELGDEYKPPLPTVVRATAIQYLRRFYLTNSPMTYHPKSIMPCALFLATKTENYYMSLRSFAEHIPNSTPEDIIAPEFLLTQGLRFTFDVRHPFRSLEGGIMELNAIARGDGAPGPHHPEQTAAGLQQAIQSLPPPPPVTLAAAEYPDQKKPGGSGSITSRIAKAHHNTREILRSAAQLTDVYFLFTPSQIWLSALLLADRPIAEFYIDTKLIPLPSTTSQSQSQSQSQPSKDVFSALRTKLSFILNSCSTILSTYQTNHMPSTAPATMKNLKRIGRKLYHCQNPEKIDLRNLNRAAKREGSSAAAVRGTGTGTGTPAAAAEAGAGVAGDGDEAELQRAAKKRKLERERFQQEGARLFGGDLVEQRKKKAEAD